MKNTLYNLPLGSCMIRIILHFFLSLSLSAPMKTEKKVNQNEQCTLPTKPTKPFSDNQNLFMFLPPQTFQTNTHDIKKEED